MFVLFCFVFGSIPRELELFVGYTHRPRSTEMVRRVKLDKFALLFLHNAGQTILLNTPDSDIRSVRK